MTSWEDLNRLKGVFDKFDKDRNHAIDKQEFAKFLEAIGRDMTADEIDYAFKEIDEDNSGVIEFDEFVDWWEASKQ